MVEPGGLDHVLDWRGASWGLELLQEGIRNQGHFKGTFRELWSIRRTKPNLGLNVVETWVEAGCTKPASSDQGLYRTGESYILQENLASKYRI